MMHMPVLGSASISVIMLANKLPFPVHVNVAHTHH